MKLSVLALGVTMLLMVSACSAEATPSEKPVTPVQTGQTEQMKSEPLPDTESLSGAELEKYFQGAFLIGQQYPVYQDEESNIKEEIGLVRDLAHNDKATLPSDYGSQYRAWRITQLSSEDSGTNNTEAVDNGEAVNSETSNTSNVETANNELTFTSCNETVYATSQVNLRSGPGTNYDKVGSLKSGASIVRTGIGTDKCVGWSRVEVSDGSIVYVSSKYLSTSKPVQQQTNTNTNTGSNTGGSQTNTNTSDSNKPPSGGKAMYGGFNTYEEYINDLHRTHPDFTIEELKDIFPDLATGHVDEEAARGDAAAGLLG